MNADLFLKRLKALRSPAVAKSHDHLASNEDKEDLIHKANGWALRFAGDKYRQRLISFLDKYAATMPCTTLRYAIEHFDKKQRDRYLSLKNRTKGETL